MMVLEGVQPCGKHLFEFLFSAIGYCHSSDLLYAFTSTVNITDSYVDITEEFKHGRTPNGMVKGNAEAFPWLLQGIVVHVVLHPSSSFLKPLLGLFQ